MNIIVLNHRKALKSVEMITELLKKEQEVIKAAEHMKRDYEKLLHDQKVESILYDQLGTDYSISNRCPGISLKIRKLTNLFALVHESKHKCIDTLGLTTNLRLSDKHRMETAPNEKAQCAYCCSMESGFYLRQGTELNHCRW